MRRKTRNLIAATVVAVVCFVAALAWSTGRAVDLMLERDARETGVAWAKYVRARLPNIDDPTAQADDMLDDAAGQDVQAVVGGVLSVGHIFQFDFINTDCYCDVSLGSFQDTLVRRGLAQTGASPHPERDGPDNGHSELITAALEHVLHALNVPHEHKRYRYSKFQFPLEQAFAETVVASGIETTRLHRSREQHLPGVFAEVFFPVKTGDQVTYLLRVLVNLEDKAANFTLAFYSGGLVITLLLTGAAMVPGRLLLLARRREKLASHRAHFLADHDILSGLYNRQALQREAPRLLKALGKAGRSATVAMFDLDKFKTTNDTHGHRAGDDVLRYFADHLRAALPPDAIAARIGGDEFVAIIPHPAGAVPDADHILPLPNPILMPFGDACITIEIGYSTGLATYPNDGDDLATLTQNADMALYVSKHEGLFAPVSYTELMGIENRRRRRLFEDFREAVENRQIIPFYQPVIDLTTGQLAGFEALVRWEHPALGLLSPAAFFDVLQDRTVNALVGAEMFRKVASDMAAWHRRGLRFHKVGLNVGEGDLNRESFADDILNGLARHCLPPGTLTIEVTENCVFYNHQQQHLEHLVRLRDAGCNIALDDFGTGYSSVTHLKNLPVTTLKIDKSFVTKVCENEVDQAIVTSLIGLGDSVGFDLVAEGIETEEQRDLLLSLGCRFGQGFLFSRPVVGSAVPGVITRFSGPGIFDAAIA